jgi:hypothetical protein
MVSPIYGISSRLYREGVGGSTTERYERSIKGPKLTAGVYQEIGLHRSWDLKATVPYIILGRKSPFLILKKCLPNSNN